MKPILEASIAPLYNNLQQLLNPQNYTMRENSKERQRKNARTSRLSK